MPDLSRRSFLAGSAATIGAAAAGLGCSGSEHQALNVLYVSVDDLGTTLGVYGRPQVITPNIDDFAEQSVVFDRCYCQVAICSASRTSILTGVRPETSGIVALEHDWQSVLPDARSLPRHFLENGYQTASVGKIFDHRGGPVDDCWTSVELEPGVHDSVAAIDRLRQVAADDQPFFLAVGFAQPHCPWDPSEESLALYDVDEIEVLGPGRTVGDGQVECYGVPGTEISDAEARDLTARYFADVTDVDRSFGEILAVVDELGLRDNTIIIFWSGDHGFHLGTNDRWGKWSNYEASTRVPLLMSVPDHTAVGSRAAGIVECVDMYPTLVELCGLSAPVHQLDGLSFAPLLTEPQQDWKHSGFSAFGISQISTRAIHTPQYNYIEQRLPFTAPSFELYDLQADPNETTNLYDSRPDIHQVLAARLEQGAPAAVPTAPPIVWS